MDALARLFLISFLWVLLLLPQQSHALHVDALQPLTTTTWLRVTNDEAPADIWGLVELQLHCLNGQMGDASRVSALVHGRDTPNEKGYRSLN